ncbi:MAG: PAS domain-containing protein, partial [Thermodesulfobacteriota bacterium]|nr:PAS domain-containing protein [Thermodesulfobacteriota bacterium]
VLSGYADTASIVDAINKGHIYKFIPKPWNDDELMVTISNAIERYLLYEKNKRLTKELGEKNAELQGFNESLEALVRERTADLEFKNQALQRSHKILDSLPVAVAGVDPEGMIVYVNQKAFDVVGMDKNVLGKDYRDCLSEEASQFLGQVFGKAIFEGSVSLSKGVFYIRGSRFYSGKDFNGFVLVFDRQEDHE